jgi:DNA repair exonuclease SbcCD nuclease subunit
MHKPIATETLLVATRNVAGDVRNYCLKLGNIEVVEYTDGEVRMILPHEIKDLVNMENAHVIVAATDDPTTDKSYDYTSLGHAHLRLTLQGGRHEKYPGKAVFVSSVKEWRNQLTVPER